MGARKVDPRFQVLDDAELNWLREELKDRSEQELARETGLSKDTIIRMAAGIRVQRLTVRCFRRHLAELPVEGRP